MTGPRYRARDATGTWSELREFQTRHSAVMARLKLKRKQRRERLATAGLHKRLVLLPLTSPIRSSSPATPVPDHRGALDPNLERRSLEQLLSPLLEFPLPCKALGSKLAVEEGVVWELLLKFNAQELLELQVVDGSVTSVNADKLSALVEEVSTASKEEAATQSDDLSIEKLLNTPSVLEMKSRRKGNEVTELLNTKSVMEKLQLEKFQSAGGSQLQEFCSHKTRDSCRRARGTHRACGKLHFRKIIQKHTDENLGDCSFLNTCFHTDTCKFVHYEIDTQREVEPQARGSGRPKPSTAVVRRGGGGGGE